MKLTPAQLYRIDVAEQAMKTANKVLISTYSDIVEECPFKSGDRVMCRLKNQPGTPEYPARIESTDVKDGEYFFAMKRYRTDGTIYADSVYDYEPTRKIEKWHIPHPRAGKQFNKQTRKYE